MLVLVGTMAGSIFNFGASSALARSYYDYEDEESRKLVISTSIYIGLFGATLLVLFSWLFNDALSRVLFNSTEYSLHVFLALVSAAITAINITFFTLLRFQRRSIQVVILNILSFGMTVGIILFLLVGLNLRVMAPILGTLLSQLALSVALIYIFRRQLVLKASLPEFPIQLKYGIPLVFVNLTYFGLDSIDRLFITIYGSLSDVGIYSLGYKIGLILPTVFTIPFSLIWLPMRLQYRKQRHIDHLFKLILTYYFMIGMFLVVVLSVFSREFVQVFSGRQDYFPAYRVVPYVALGHLVYGAVNVIDNGIIFERKIVYHVYIFSIALLVNAGLNFVLVPSQGYIAAAYTTLITYALVIGLVAVVSNHISNIHWDPKRLFLIVTSGIITLVAGGAITSTMLAVVVPAKSVLVITLLLTWYWIVLSRRERSKIHLMGSNLLQFILSQRKGARHT